MNFQLVCVCVSVYVRVNVRACGHACARVCVCVLIICPHHKQNQITVCYHPKDFCVKLMPCHATHVACESAKHSHTLHAPFQSRRGRGEEFSGSHMDCLSSTLLGKRIHVALAYFKSQIS